MWTHLFVFVIISTSFFGTDASEYDATIAPMTDDMYTIGFNATIEFYQTYVTNLYTNDSTSLQFIADVLKADIVTGDDGLDIGVEVDWFPSTSSLSLGNDTAKWNMTSSKTILVDSVTFRNNGTSVGDETTPMDKVITEKLHWQGVISTTGYYDVIAEVQDVSVSNDTVVNITYSTVSKDESGSFSNSRVFIPPAKGLYRVSLVASYDYDSSAGGGVRQMYIIKSGNLVGSQMIMPKQLNTYGLTAEILVVLDTSDTLYTQLYAYSQESSIDADCYLAIRLENGYA
jgi:hypothetical protein